VRDFKACMVSSSWPCPLPSIMDNPSISVYTEIVCTVGGWP
jgi:hypothetical protein